ncbi:hypothetical protein GEMRC1_013034 [Eukaryota sp. GEM-RC1]
MGRFSSLLDHLTSVDFLPHSVDLSDILVEMHDVTELLINVSRKIDNLKENCNKELLSMDLWIENGKAFHLDSLKTVFEDYLTKLNIVMKKRNNSILLELTEICKILNCSRGSPVWLDFCHWVWSQYFNYVIEYCQNIVSVLESFLDSRIILNLKILNNSLILSDTDRVVPLFSEIFSKFFSTISLNFPHSASEATGTLTKNNHQKPKEFSSLTMKINLF